jgi:hypothetical protein
MKTKLFAVILLAAGIPTAAIGATSEQYAKKGRELWAAFECSILASELGNQNESKRLFMLGYNDGKTFIDADQKGAISQNDLNNKVPIIVLMLLNGPSGDFMLGQIYNSATSEMMKKLYQHKADSTIAKINAENQFRTRNCSLIGTP